MLLRHPWLAPLMQPPTESEASAGPAPDEQGREGSSSAVTEDKEVSDWVHERLAYFKSQEHQSPEKPALHAVALDAVPGSPLLDEANPALKPS